MTCQAKVPTYSGWKCVLTYGSSLDLYARGNKRKAIDRKTGRVIVDYTVPWR